MFKNFTTNTNKKGKRYWAIALCFLFCDCFVHINRCDECILTVSGDSSFGNRRGVDVS